MMGMSTAKGSQGRLHFAREAMAIVISVISFIISTVNVYVTNLKSPDLNLIVAPFIRQIVDNTSLNEAFFIPVTVTNQGAKPGSLLSFELTVTYLPSGVQETYYAQYVASSENPETLGSFFAPMNLAGYSADGHTLCFYPLGERDGNFFNQPGKYEFLLTAMAANVKGQSSKRITQGFQVELTQEMFEQMQKEPDFEYRYPLPIETNEARRPLIEIISDIFR
jgi:hypothetical protein